MPSCVANQRLRTTPTTSASATVAATAITATRRRTTIATRARCSEVVLHRRTKMSRYPEKWRVGRGPFHPGSSCTWSCAGSAFATRKKAPAAAAQLKRRNMSPATRETCVQQQMLGCLLLVVKEVRSEGVVATCRRSYSCSLSHYPVGSGVNTDSNARQLHPQRSQLLLLH